MHTLRTGPMTLRTGPMTLRTGPMTQERGMDSKNGVPVNSKGLPYYPCSCKRAGCTYDWHHGNEPDDAPAATPPRAGSRYRYFTYGDPPNDCVWRWDGERMTLIQDGADQPSRSDYGPS